MDSLLGSGRMVSGRVLRVCFIAVVAAAAFVGSTQNSQPAGTSSEIRVNEDVPVNEGIPSEAINTLRIGRDESGPWYYKSDNIAVYATQGPYSYMEDRYDIHKRGSLLGFGVFDGHRAPDIAEYAAENLLPNVMASFKKSTGTFDSIRQKCCLTSAGSKLQLNVELIKNATEALDKEILIQEVSNRSGSTAVFGIVDGNILYMANVGDSRAVGGRIVPRGHDQLNNPSATYTLTTDHKPDLEKERQRIESSGGFVEMNRADGMLAMSRSLGDARVKHHGVISTPEVTIVDWKKEKLDYVILASDGVWDVTGNDVAVGIVNEAIKTDPLFGAKQLATKARTLGRSRDNIAVMIVKLRN